MAPREWRFQEIDQIERQKMEEEEAKIAEAEREVGATFPLQVAVSFFFSENFWLVASFMLYVFVYCGVYLSTMHVYVTRVRVRRRRSRRWRV